MTDHKPLTADIDPHDWLKATFGDTESEAVTVTASTGPSPLGETITVNIAREDTRRLVVTVDGVPRFITGLYGGGHTNPEG